MVICCCVDAGCEYDYYASDITRTYPVNGRFSEAQRAIYEIVLEANAGRHRKSAPRIITGMSRTMLRCALSPPAFGGSAS